MSVEVILVVTFVLASCYLAFRQGGEPERIAAAIIVAWIMTDVGYHLIFVEGKKPAGTESFAEAKGDIREFLMAQRAADVMGTVKRLTNELRASSKVAFYPENVK